MTNNPFNFNQNHHSQQINHQFLTNNTDTNLFGMYPNQKTIPALTMSAQKKNQQFRYMLRCRQIDGMKKAARFNWNAQHTLQYLRTISNKVVQSEQILNDAIQFQLIVPADPFFRIAVLQKSNLIVNLIQKNLNYPSCILLLGNLCTIYEQFIRLLQEKTILTKLMSLMNDMKSNSQCAQIYCWALTKLARQPTFLQKNQVQTCIPYLYQTMCQNYPPKQHNRTLFTHLCRLVSQFSIVLEFPQQFLSYMLTVQPSRQIDKQNLLISLQTQIKMFKYSSNSHFRIRILQYLLKLYLSCCQKLPKTKKISVYQLIIFIVSRSEIQVSEYIVYHMFNEIVGQYRYGIIQYYKMVQKILQKLNNINQQSLLQRMRNSGLIENFVNDISDANTQIGYMCLRIVTLITKQVMSCGNISYLEWMLGLDLQLEVQSFLDSVKNNDKIAKEAENFLNMIYSQ